MDTDHPSLVNLLVWIMVVLVLIQTALIVVVTFVIRQKIVAIDRTLHSFYQRTLIGMKLLCKMVDTVEDSLPKLPMFQKTIETNIEVFVAKIQAVTRAVGRGVDLVRYQSTEIESRIDSALMVFSQKINAIYQAAHHPSRHLIHFVQFGIEFLKRTSPEKNQPHASHRTKDTEKSI